VKSELQQGIAFAEGLDRLHLLKLRAEELMLPKVSCRNLVEALLRLVGVKLSSMPEKIFRELESFQLANCGLEGSRLLG
jgi:hypothetical protein